MNKEWVLNVGRAGKPALLFHIKTSLLFVIPSVARNRETQRVFVMNEIPDSLPAYPGFPPSLRCSGRRMKNENPDLSRG
jgi:hypothetical protein